MLRDLLATADLLISQYRYSHRIPKSVGFCAVLPDWARDLVRSDLAREVAHDNAGEINVLVVTDDQIGAYFKARGIQVTWTVDALRAGTYGSGGQAIGDQFFGLLSAGETELTWPGQSAESAITLAWLLFPQGTYQFIDGGRLDLGVVRDSTLDATNDYEVFSETFESVAMRGLECYQIHSTVLPNGGSAGTAALTGYDE